MAGRKDKVREEKQDPAQPVAQDDRRRVFRRFHSVWKWVAGGVFAGGIAIGGSDIKNPGGDIAMAVPRMKAQSPEERLIDENVEKATAAFRKYVFSGDPKEKELFVKLFEGKWTDDRQKIRFRDRLNLELERLVGEKKGFPGHPLIKPVWDAYKGKLGRVGALPLLRPAHFTDFLSAISDVRSGLETSIASQKVVDRLVAKVKEADDKKAYAKTGSDIDLVRKMVSRGVGLEDAARRVIERPAYERLVATYGEGFVSQLAARMPKLQADRCINAMRGFILSGDMGKREEFLRIWRDNQKSDDFIKAVVPLFKERIVQDVPSGLKAVIDAYRTHQRGQGKPDMISPVSFVTLVGELYKRATEGKPDEAEDLKIKRNAAVEGLRKENGKEVVDALLSIVARGMADRAIVLLKDVVRTGNSASEKALLDILNGNLATIVDDAIEMKAVQHNPVFWDRFVKLYSAYKRSNSNFADLDNILKSRNLEVSIRDVVVEFGKPVPDMNRLLRTHGREFVSLVKDNIGSLLWLVREPEQLASAIGQRAQRGDKSAEGLSAFKFAGPTEKALAEAYLVLISGRVGMAGVAPELIEYMKKNRDKLGFLTMSMPGIIQNELKSRAAGKTPEAAFAKTVLDKYGDDAGATLYKAYQAFDAYTRGREGLVKKYTEEFVSYVDKNIQHLYWILKPAEEIGRSLKAHDPFVIALHTDEKVGYSALSLASAVRDIHRSLGAEKPDRERLVKLYGEKLVAHVESDRGALRWAATAALDQVAERIINPGKDSSARALVRFIFLPKTGQLISAIARSRFAVAERGLALMDAQDAYTVRFTEASLREHTPKPLSADVNKELKAIEVMRKGIVKTLRKLERDIGSYEMLEPARAVLRAKTREWQDEAMSIHDAAKRSKDLAEAQSYSRKLKDLQAGIITLDDLRKTVRLVFSAIHMAETGADLRTGAMTSTLGFLGTSTDANTINSLISWYGAQKEKQPLIGAIAQKIMKKASPDFYRFLLKLEGADLMDALTKTYDAVEKKDTRKMKEASTLYGSDFVKAVQAQKEHLSLLKGVITPEDIRFGKNRFYSEIVKRCFLAISEERMGEDREAMEKLYGKAFVAAIVKHKDALLSLKQAGDVLKLVGALPADAQKEIFQAYPGAYAMTIPALERAFFREEAGLMSAMQTIYRAQSGRPPANAKAAEKERFEKRMKDLEGEYGRKLISLVLDNRAEFWFLGRGKESRVVPYPELSSRLDRRKDLIMKLHEAYRESDTAQSPIFMLKLQKVSTKLPVIFAMLRAALTYDKPDDQIGPQLKMAIEEYRRSFGKGKEADYLLKKYINIDLFARKISDMSRTLGVHLPDEVRVNGIPDLEALAKFLTSDAGKALVKAGREQFERMHQQYSSFRANRPLDAASDFSDTSLINLKSSISIIDALYLGMIGKRSGSDVFGPAASIATMECILALSGRDPYLIGPFLFDVLEPMMSVVPDEGTLVNGLRTFITSLRMRYDSSTSDLAFSSSVIREHYLKKFAALAIKIKEAKDSFRHTNIEDEFKQYPRVGLTQSGFGGTDMPYPFKLKSPWYSGQDLSQVKPQYLSLSLPKSMLPLVSPTGVGIGTTVNYGTRASWSSGAVELMRMNREELSPPPEGMARPTVPAGKKINVMGSAVLMRVIMGVMSKPLEAEKKMFWLSASGDVLGSYGSETDASGAIRRGGGATGLIAGRGVSGGIYAEVKVGAGTSESGEGDAKTITTVTSGAGTLRVANLPFKNFPILKAGVVRSMYLTVEGAKTEATATTTDDLSGVSTSVKTRTAEYARGTMETFIDLAKKKGGLFVYFKGNRVPELLGPKPAGGGEAAVLQEREEMAQARIMYIHSDGSYYQAACGTDSVRQLGNVLYAALSNDKALLEAQMMARTC
ncbi:MAG: hypothetical protein V1827_06275 [Candidatus Micrarchaeota archaeon]